MNANPTPEAAFRPSQVAMLSRSVTPFLDTFRRTEIEMAAGMLVAASAHHGDAWAPIVPRQIGEWLKAESSIEPPSHWATLLNNPFFRPNFDELIADGWARWVGDESEGRSRPIELTPAAFARIREKGWVSG